MIYIHGAFGRARESLRCSASYLLTNECTQRVLNETSLVLRGDIRVPLDDLYDTICGIVQHVVDHDAAVSISGVRYLAGNLVQVRCDDTKQCQRIISRRMAFSSVDTTPHQSATVRRLLRTRLYVDNYCTQEQLQIRGSLWKVFRELKAAGKRPFFVGEVLHYHPEGNKRAVVHSGSSSAPSEEQLLPAVKAGVQDEQQQQPLQQQQQQLPQSNHKPQHQGQAPMPSAAPEPCPGSPAPTTSAPTPTPSSAAAPTPATEPSASVPAEQAVLQPTTRSNVPAVSNSQPQKRHRAGKSRSCQLTTPSSRTRSGSAHTRTTAG